MNLFRALTFAENCLGIHRNYSCMSKKRQILVIIQVIVQICVSLAIIGNSIVNAHSLNTPLSVLLKFHLFCVMIILTHMILSIGGIVNSQSYTIFLESINSLDTRFENEPSYSNSEKNLKRKCLVISILFTILTIQLAGIKLYNGYIKQKYFLLEIVVIVMYEFWVDIRYVLEHLVIYCAITLIYKYVKCLNNSVREVLDKLKDDENIQILSDADEEYDIVKKVSYWTEVYQDILASSKHISKCFNGMMFVSLATAVIQTVSSAYDIIGLVIIKSVLNVNEVIYVSIYHMGATITLLFAGQKLQNEFSTLNIALASLANQVSIYDQKSVIRSLRDLNRIVTTNPIVIKFGNFTLGMYLMPLMLSMSATYIVILLQFNHVI